MSGLLWASGSASGILPTRTRAERKKPSPVRKSLYSFHGSHFKDMTRKVELGGASAELSVDVSISLPELRWDHIEVSTFHVVLIGAFNTLVPSTSG